MLTTPSRNEYVTTPMRRTASQDPDSSESKGRPLCCEVRATSMPHLHDLSHWSSRLETVGFVGPADFHLSGTPTPHSRTRRIFDPAHPLLTNPSVGAS